MFKPDVQFALIIVVRVQKSLIPQGIQHPVLLPKDYRATKLIVDWCHDQFEHACTGITTNLITMFSFWIWTKHCGQINDIKICKM